MRSTSRSGCSCSKVPHVFAAAAKASEAASYLKRLVESVDRAALAYEEKNSR